MLTIAMSETPSEVPSETATAEVIGSDAAEMANLDAVIDESLIPIFSSSNVIEDDEGTEEEHGEHGTGEASINNASQLVSVTKRKNKSKGTLARGPTALPKNRGNGFEGTASHSLIREKGLMLNDNRIFCRSTHDSRRS
jgi:hypothetical protein